jgi:ATPase family associated with various cellular activities (AAA)
MGRTRNQSKTRPKASASVSEPTQPLTTDPRNTITPSFTETVVLEITPAFGKYVTRNAGFVKYVEGVRDQIIGYIGRPSVKRPLNILLAAPPGTGKSFLIKQLIEWIDFKARKLDVSFEESNIASFENASELYGLFQRVQSVNLEGKVPVVFFDEVDTEIGGNKLFAKFLAPMWDGTFYVGKERFFLGRSIFFFAGSTLSHEDISAEILKDHNKDEPLTYDEYFVAWKSKFDERNKMQGDKLPDFLDRIDEVVLIPPIRKELLGNNLKREYEELACMMILKHFPTIKYVGKLALETISEALRNAKSMRTAEKIVFNSRPGDDELFDLRCLPARYQKHRDANSDALGPDGQEKGGWQIGIRSRN